MRDNLERNEQRKPRSRVRKIVLSIILVLLLSIGGVSGYMYYQYQAVKNDTASEPVYDDAELGIDPTVAEELSGYRNIVIYGLDNTKRSDVILLISINNETKHGKLMTIYRDTYMQLSPDKTYTFADAPRDFFKCNHSYKKAGKIHSINMLNRHLDLNIRECLGLDWDAVATLVDYLDGITVSITNDLASFINRGLEDPIVVKNGQAVLNGEQAVAYLRVRKDPGSSAVTRSMRNQQVFLDLFNRAKTMDKDAVLDIFTKMLGKVETNMKVPSMLSLLKDMRSYELESASGWPYAYSILWDDAFYYYVPNTLETNVSELHYNLFEQGGYQVSDTCRQLSETIKLRRNDLY